MIWRRQQASITDGVLFYLHNTSSLGRWCGLCKTTLDLWGHFHACYHRKYECLSACVREGTSPGYWQLHTHTHTHSARIQYVRGYTHTHTGSNTGPCALFSGDSELWRCAESQTLTHKTHRSWSFAELCGKRACVCVHVCICVCVCVCVDIEYVAG